MTNHHHYHRSHRNHDIVIFSISTTERFIAVGVITSFIIAVDTFIIVVIDAIVTDFNTATGAAQSPQTLVLSATFIAVTAYVIFTMLGLHLPHCHLRPYRHR